MKSFNSRNKCTKSRVTKSENLRLCPTYTLSPFFLLRYPDFQGKCDNSVCIELACGKLNFCRVGNAVSCKAVNHKSEEKNRIFPILGRFLLVDMHEIKISATPCSCRFRLGIVYSASIIRCCCIKVKPILQCSS